MTRYFNEERALELVARALPAAKWSDESRKPYTAEFIAAHLLAGRPLCTLGVDPRLLVVKRARELAAKKRIEQQKERG